MQGKWDRELAPGEPEYNIPRSLPTQVYISLEMALMINPDSGVHTGQRGWLEEPDSSQRRRRGLCMFSHQ